MGKDWNGVNGIGREWIHRSGEEWSGEDRIGEDLRDGTGRERFG